MIQNDNRKSHSAEFLWRLFEQRHNGRKKAFKIDGFKIYFVEEGGSEKEWLFQLSDGKIKRIGRSAFGGYVKEAKQSLK
jgi:hypothetical protein